MKVVRSRPVFAHRGRTSPLRSEPSRSSTGRGVRRSDRHCRRAPDLRIDVGAISHRSVAALTCDASVPSDRAEKRDQRSRQSAPIRPRPPVHPEPTSTAVPSAEQTLSPSRTSLRSAVVVVKAPLYAAISARASSFVPGTATVGAPSTRPHPNFARVPHPCPSATVRRGPIGALGANRCDRNRAGAGSGAGQAADFGGQSAGGGECARGRRVGAPGARGRVLVASTWRCPSRTIRAGWRRGVRRRAASGWRPQHG